MLILAAALFAITIIAIVYCRITRSKRNITTEELFDRIRQNLRARGLNAKETGEKEWAISKNNPQDDKG